MTRYTAYPRLSCNIVLTLSLTVSLFIMDIRQFCKKSPEDAEILNPGSDGDNGEPKEKHRKTSRPTEAGTDVESSEGMILLEDSIIDVEVNPDFEEERDILGEPACTGEGQPGDIAGTSSGHVVSGPADISQVPDCGPTQPGLTETFRFPKTHGRKFIPDWYKTSPWLEYSASTDKAYCFVCRHFTTGRAYVYTLPVLNYS
jgi:hypothetical protein